MTEKQPHPDNFAALHPRRPDARNLLGRPEITRGDATTKAPPGPAGSLWTGIKGPGPTLTLTPAARTRSGSLQPR